VLALGGPVVFILACLSLVALTIIVFKTVELYAVSSRGRAEAQGAIELWRSNQRLAALSALSEPKPGLQRMLNVAMQGRQEYKADSLLREEMLRLLSDYRERLHANLRTLDVIGSVSPLLGLFGTVLGMIEAFRQMEAAGANVDPSVFSGGIWQALLTTGVGLAVAIPVVLAHQWLERRAAALSHSAEDAVTQIFTADLHIVEPVSEMKANLEQSRAT